MPSTPPGASSRHGARIAPRCTVDVASARQHPLVQAHGELYCEDGLSDSELATLRAQTFSAGGY